VSLDLVPLEPRVVLSYSFPGITGVAFDASGDLFVSYDSTSFFTGQQQSVAEISANGQLVTSSLFRTTGSSATPGDLITVGTGAGSIPNASSATDILELQPNGQLYVFDPSTGTSATVDNFANLNAKATSVYDVQTGQTANLSSDISLANATFGPFGVDGSSIIVSGESNNWDFLARVTYASGSETATVLVASPASDQLTASPGGVAVDPQGTVLATLPYLPSGATTAIHVPVAFNLFYDQGATPKPYLPQLGLSTQPNIDSTGITVDSQDNFILAAETSSLYGGGPGVVHINSSLNAFLADPTTPTQAIASSITYQSVGGNDYLALAYSDEGSYTIAGEIPLFSGQVTPAQLRAAYGVNQINFTGSGGTTVAGTGAGQTIAIVEEGVDPTLQADLHTFDQYFGIPDPPSFQTVDQNGVTTQNLDIVGEASLDVEWAHAIAPGASIVVYNSAYDPNNATTSFENLIEAMHEASLLPGVSVVTLSYGEPEAGLASLGLSESQLDANFTTPGVTFLAASGDSGIFGNGGYQVTTDYPASSSNVVAVGGTSIVIDSNGDYPGTGTSGETGWGAGNSSGSQGGSGGGLSSGEEEPSWQTGVVPSSVDSSGTRAVPDVAMDSGTAQEYDVFTSTLSASSTSSSAVGWLGDAGTSAAAPIWAGLIAIADQGRALAGGTPLTGNTQTLPALYSLPATDFHDILYGNNGDAAGPGYDLVTGRGTPIANLLVPALASYGTTTQIAVKASPATAVVGNQVTLTATVTDSGTGKLVSGGMVTFADGSVILGSGTITNGTASVNTTPTSSGTETITVTYGGDSGESGSSTTFILSVQPAQATPASISLSNLNVTYNESAQGVDVTTNPPDLSGVTVVYTQNGVVVANPTRAGTYSVTATLNNPSYAAPAATATFVINQATPAINWSAPAAITQGTRLSATQLDASASFAGVSLSGAFVYSPAAGTILPAGNGQILTATFEPTDATDFRAVTVSVPINVIATSTPSPTPTQAVIVGEQALVKRKTNKRGKPVGPAVPYGFSFQFSGPLDLSSASNPANYLVDSVTIKKVKKVLERVMTPVANFHVSYNTGDDVATITFTGTEPFAKGGQIAVLGGVTAGSDSRLAGATTFKISNSGKTITPT
jgi:hypothetical protein